MGCNTNLIISIRIYSHRLNIPHIHNTPNISIPSETINANVDINVMKIYALVGKIPADAR